VHEFCSCGAKLPEDARFCHKCGQPQFEDDVVREAIPEPPPVVDVPVVIVLPGKIDFQNALAVRIAFLMALLSSVLIELLAPILFGPIFLFTGLVTGGGAAAYLYSRKASQSLSIRNGLRMGWLTGLFSFVIFLVTTTIKCIAVSFDKGLSQFFRDELTNYPGRNADMDQLIKILQTPEGLGVFLFLSIVVMFVLFTLLPTIGGAIGAKFSERE
jgi:hypothetical protein